MVYYLDVPYAQKDSAKSAGAKWDKAQKQWYIPEELEITNDFLPWLSETQKIEVGPLLQQQRFYLAVPYDDREQAKSAGAKWDKDAKSWYADCEEVKQACHRWHPVIAQNSSADIRAEFSDALRAAGMVVSGEHPVIDGKKHRIKTVDDKGSQTSGYYIAYTEGQHPAGFIKNFRTGEEVRWKSGYNVAVDAVQQAALKAQSEITKQQRQRERQDLYEKRAEELAESLHDLVPVTSPLQYHLTKQIPVYDGIFQNNKGQLLYIPAYDVEDKLWTIQYITAEGDKKFGKDTRKERCFHVVGGFEALEACSVIIIAEGYATAATIKQAVDMPVVAAFDSGNLKPVAESLRAKFPDKPIIIAGDDDYGLEQRKGKNPGKEKAQAAASAVDGHAIFPVFAEGERDNSEKDLTDFNDLACYSIYGLAAVRVLIENQLRLLKN